MWGLNHIYETSQKMSLPLNYHLNPKMTLFIIYWSKKTIYLNSIKKQ